jgi:hypothetical protein
MTIYYVPRHQKKQTATPKSKILHRGLSDAQ